jgi:CDP-diacylglycerol--serine O-phosphatidyltransferase
VATPIPKRAIVPTLLTLGNAVSGLAAVAFTSKIGKIGTTPEDNWFYMASGGWLIVVAMLFDALDGYAARLSKTAGHFGAELDSLCDAISFGLAPAFLLFQVGPAWEQPSGWFWHRALVIAATIYLVGVILRLARFNVENLTGAATGGTKKFRGLPSPAAAGCVASLAIVKGSLHANWPSLDTPAVHTAIETVAIFGSLLVAVLMVSPVPYPHLTKGLLGGRKKAVLPLFTLIPVCLLSVLLRELMLVVLFWTYALAWLGTFAFGPRTKPVTPTPAVDASAPSPHGP